MPSTGPGSRLARIPSRQEPIDLLAAMQSRVIGQPAAIEAILPFIEMFQAGLSPEDRPAGIFLLLGPTGTGKTKTVEALADVLLGTEKAVVKVDCAEFAHSHEIAKLIGSPPGYLGHRETHPLLSQEALNQYHTESTKLSLVLFDEVEKASDTLWNLLLGIMDKARLTLGDNRRVDFSRTMIFLTSNLGGRDIQRSMKPAWGLEAALPPQAPKAGALAAIGLAAAKKKFTPEFMNRLDVTITFEPLARHSLWKILDQLIRRFQTLIIDRLGERSFQFDVDRDARKFLLKRGVSLECGARELKRVLQKHLAQPIGKLVASGQIPPGTLVEITLRPDGEDLLFTTVLS
jgi:ATP-dependent Clp protease ATP-binding subunit ClpA